MCREIWVLQGFRKIDSDWKFTNEGFQGGKKRLLKKIKRKNRYNNNYKKQDLGLSMTTTLEDLTKPVLVEIELETLKTEQHFESRNKLVYKTKNTSKLRHSFKTTMSILTFSFRGGWKFFRISSEIWT